MFSSSQLKERFRPSLAEEPSQDWCERIHRAISWLARSEQETEDADAAVMQGDTATVLSVTFDRLYVLRDQLIHGGATWNSQVNRGQLRDWVAILTVLVPLVVGAMLEYLGVGLG